MNKRSPVLRGLFPYFHSINPYLYADQFDRILNKKVAPSFISFEIQLTKALILSLHRIIS